MKLRVRNNSVRLRLTQSEVAEFKQTGIIKETIEFGPTLDKILTYALAVADDEKAVNAQYHDGKITIFVPRAEADNWISSEQIGIETDQNIGSGKTLRILIEKDFACTAHRDGEDDSNAFPRPK